MINFVLFLKTNSFKRLEKWVKVRSFGKLEESKEKVRLQVQQLEMKEKGNKRANNCDCYSSSYSSQSKVVNNGWILTSQQMQFLRNYPYIYCAFAGSYLELLFLQR
jgi:hypothetical protein